MDPTGTNLVYIYKVYGVTGIKYIEIDNNPVSVEKDFSTDGVSWQYISCLDSTYTYSKITDYTSSTYIRKYNVDTKTDDMIRYITNPLNCDIIQVSSDTNPY
jgi:hypothetical protein